MWPRWFNFLVNDLGVFKFDYILLQCFICSLYRKKKIQKSYLPTYSIFFFFFFEYVTPNTLFFLPNLQCAYLCVIRTYAYQGVRNVCFSEILACFAFLKHSFWDSPFCLITDDKAFQLILPTKPFRDTYYAIAFCLHSLGNSKLNLLTTYQSLPPSKEAQIDRR